MNLNKKEVAKFRRLVCRCFLLFHKASFLFLHKAQTRIMQLTDVLSVFFCAKSCDTHSNTVDVRRIHLQL